MGKLENWDFGNSTLNSSMQQVNRQKSAMNLEILELDIEKKECVFFDEKNGEIRASLTTCKCRDFNFTGGNPRKKFAPYMHIDRLAIELGLMKAQHYDRKATLAMMTPEEYKAKELRHIREIEPDPTRWGYWGEKVHSARSQQDRQHRAYKVFESKDFEVLNDETARVSGYRTTLRACTCPDFTERGVPCKHIYCLALIRGHQLRVSFEEFKCEEECFENNFVPLIEIGVKIDPDS